MDVAFDGPDVRERRSLERKQLMTHRHEMLGDDVQPECGIRWWMSATRPATEFSIGIIPSLASPELMAENASSNVAHGTGSRSG